MIKIATRKGLWASIDWLQIRIFGMKFEDIARNILGIPEEYFSVESGRLQHYNYDYCYRFGDIRIYDYLDTNYDDYFWYESKGFEPGDNMLVLSGKACDFLREVWLSQMNISFKTFMKNLLVYEKRITITRIDVAIDDFNEKPFFTPTQHSLRFVKKNNSFTEKARPTFLMEMNKQELPYI